MAYTGVKVLAPAFYSLGRPRVPLLASLAAVATNLVVIFALHSRLGYRAVALGTSLGALVNAVVLVVGVRKARGRPARRRHGAARRRMAAAAALMGPAAWAGRVLARAAGGDAGPVRAGRDRPRCRSRRGLLVYLGAARLLRIPEAGPS